MPLIRSISGLRGTIGDGLTPDIVLRYVAAFAGFCAERGGAIVVGRDGRPSGRWIEELVVGVLTASGVEVRTIGMAPTPTVQLATEHSDAVGGISITASHNPAEWNGLKFLNRDGLFLDGDECSRFFELVDEHHTRLVGWNAGGQRVAVDDALRDHCARALALPFVPLEELRRRRYTVVVDAVNASGSQVVPALLESCGCTVVRLFCAGDGLFPHAPEPVPENLSELAAAVVRSGADFGVAVDPDGDRLVLIDERGMPIGEEYTIAQAVDFVLRWERRTNPEAELKAVVNLSTTRAVEDVAQRYGARVDRTPVGEINVARHMKNIGAVIGGEGSGGVILPALHVGRDALAGIVIVLANMVEHGGTMSRLRADLPQYVIVKRKIVLGEGARPNDLFTYIAAHDAAGARIRTDDGLKLDFEDSWVHLRASNTEPIVRVIAEAPTHDRAAQLADMFLEKTVRAMS